MPSGPFTISVDYLHGTLEGCIRVTAVPHITIYKIPHDFAPNLMTERELKQAGIYILINLKQNTIYIGQADARESGKGILGRMMESHSKPGIDVWDYGYALTSGTPQFFGATELNYLEQYFYDQAKNCGRYALLNGNRPHATGVSFSTKTLLSSYTEYAFFLLRHQLGCDAFIGASPIGAHKTKKVVTSASAPKTIATSHTSNLKVLYGETLSITNQKMDVDARGILIDDKHIKVLKGSRISLSSNLPNQKGQMGRERLRTSLMNDGTIQNRFFVKDYIFDSTSTAASVIKGASSSGMKQWKDKNGNPIGMYLH